MLLMQQSPSTDVTALDSQDPALFKPHTHAMTLLRKMGKQKEY